MMTSLRTNPPEQINGNKVVKINDYEKSVSINTETRNETVLTLPKSNVICFFTEDGSTLTVRPSGTEPKIKVYIGAVGDTYEQAVKAKDGLIEAGTKLLGF